MVDDPLDGYRAPIAAVARNIESMGSDDALWQRLYLGDAAQKIMRGVAQKTDVAKVMAMMIARCELETQALCQQIIMCEDLNDPVAKKAHFDARVSAGILGRLNQFVNDGQRAAEQINDRGQSE